MKQNNVRVISQKEYDMAVPGQQAFYNSLVAQGRARIGDDPEPEPVSTTSPVVDKAFKNPVIALKGKRVTIVLVDGSTCTGTLDMTTQYEIVVDGTIFWKHGVLSMVECK